MNKLDILEIVIFQAQPIENSFSFTSLSVLEMWDREVLSTSNHVHLPIHTGNMCSLILVTSGMVCTETPVLARTVGIQL